MFGWVGSARDDSEGVMCELGELKSDRIKDVPCRVGRIHLGFSTRM